MADVPNKALSPEELKELKHQRQLNAAIDELDERFTKRAEIPSIVFGRLLAVLAVSIFLDATGWVTAFLSGKFYYVFSSLLTASETVCIVGMAGLAIFGSIESYKQQKAIKALKENFQSSE